MFETLKHWLDESHKHAKLFEHEHDELIHLALASLLYRMMMADQNETDSEKHEFSRIMKHEFDLSDTQVSALHDRVKSISCDLDHDLETISNYLKDKPMVKLNFMRMLNHMSNLDGFDAKEMDIFDQATKVLFPDLKQDRL